MLQVPSSPYLKTLKDSIKRVRGCLSTTPHTSIYTKEEKRACVCNSKVDSLIRMACLHVCVSMHAHQYLSAYALDVARQKALVLRLQTAKHSDRQTAKHARRTDMVAHDDS